MNARTVIRFATAEAFHVGNDAYTVELPIGNGLFAYHVGPKTFPYFTKEQAEALAAKVTLCGSIDVANWTDGYLRPLKASDVVCPPAITLQ